MGVWKVTIDNDWGKFPGVISPVTYKLRAASYGEALQRAARKFVEAQFKMHAEEIQEPLRPEHMR